MSKRKIRTVKAAVCPRRPKQDKSIGMEVELEFTEPGIRMTNDMANFWSTTDEGSLRFFGVEFITKGALNRSEAGKAIDLLCKAFGEHPLRIKDSKRTSTHVHINMQNYNVLNMYTAMAAYWLFENLLIKYCGDASREGNLFCLRLKDSDCLIRLIRQDLMSGGFFNSMPPDLVRYAALNPSALKKFGSLEFRSMGNTLKSERLKLWAFSLNDMVKSCAKFKDPADFLDAYFMQGPDKMMRRIFPDRLIDLLQRRNPNWKPLIEENEGLVSDLAYCIEWQDHEKMYNPPKGKKKEEDDLETFEAEAGRLGDIAAGVGVAEEFVRQHNLRVLRDNNHVQEPPLPEIEDDIRNLGDEDDPR